MIVLLSPAKTLDFSDTSLPIAHNAPRGFQDAEHLITDLEKLSKSQLKALLKVSDSITRSVFQYREEAVASFSISAGCYLDKLACKTKYTVGTVTFQHPWHHLQ